MAVEEGLFLPHMAAVLFPRYDLSMKVRPYICDYGFIRLRLWRRFRTFSLARCGQATTFLRDWPFYRGRRFFNLASGGGLNISP
nr:hypothetical protein Q903MT_gene560 [Picea sitchensis]